MLSITKKFEHLKIQLEAIISATNNFAESNCIGRGGFGKVYKGELHVHLKGYTTVALKRLDRAFGQGDPEFWKEIIMLSLYRHENIVFLLGFCDDGGEKILVYEYASKKSLDLYLTSSDLTWDRRLKICIGAASGLAYLHNPAGTQQRVLHRDIKSSNILLDENWNARIGDLGLSKFGPANQPYTFIVSNTVGTLGYCDPIYIETGLLTKESDVYSFGVVLFEVLCGRLCVGNNHKGQSFTEMVRKSYKQNKLSEIVYGNIKDEINIDSLKTFSTIAYRCLKRDREQRPSMNEVVKELEIALMYQHCYLTSVSAATTAPQRRLWVKNGSKDRWDKCNSPDFPEEEFRKAFRMGKDTFELICNELITSLVAKENTMFPVRQRVAVCIWRLATGDPLSLVSQRFGLGISTCHKLVLEVCSDIKNVLIPKYLKWPDDDSIRTIKNEFSSISGIPNVVGSMYTTHIPIIAPKISDAPYFNTRHTDTETNQQTSYSITVQGVVDPQGIFTDVCIGWPGSMPDDQVLEKSVLHQRANGGLLKDVWIVGSSGYPLMDWVLVPYTQPNLTWTQMAFNEKISEIQRVAKDAFARLKGRWSCLQKQTEVKPQDLPVVLGACCVLHNICEMRNEEVGPELQLELMDDEMVMKARDSIAHNLLHHNLAGTSFLS